MKLFGNRRHAEHVQKTKKETRKTVNVLLIIFACIAVLAAGIFVAAKLIIKPVTIKTTPTVQKKITKPSDDAPAVETEMLVSHKEGVYNILVCGTDDDGYRTDTIIVAHMNTKNHTAALMSIPRDTPILRGDHLSKINSVYGGDKEEGMVRLSGTLEKLLGFPMDGYLLVDLDAFKDSVDLIGGVWFDVPQDMYYEDPTQDLLIDLKKGHQLLDGEHAMELVRFRKGYASQDIQRTSVQQDFLIALSDQTIKALSLSKISKFANIFKTYVTTDMTVGNMLYFASEIKKCADSDIESYTVEGAGVMVNGGSYYALFDWSILDIVNKSFNPYDTPVTAGDITVVTPDIAKSYDSSQPEEEATEETSEETDPTQTEIQTTDNTAPDGVVAEWGYDPMQQPAAADTPSDAVWSE